MNDPSNQPHESKPHGTTRLNYFFSAIVLLLANVENTQSATNTPATVHFALSGLSDVGYLTNWALIPTDKFLLATNGVGFGGFTFYGGNMDIGPYSYNSKDIANIQITGSPSNDVNGIFSYVSNIVDGNGRTIFYTNGGSYTMRINNGTVFDDVVEIVTNNAPYPPPDVGQGVFTAHDPVRIGTSVSIWQYSGSGEVVEGMTSSYLTNQLVNVNALFQTNFPGTTEWLTARLPAARIGSISNHTDANASGLTNAIPLTLFPARHRTGVGAAVLSNAPVLLNAFMSGAFFPSNALSTWPAAPARRGDFYIGNSNGYPYILLSTNGAIGSTTWTGTNKLGW